MMIIILMLMMIIIIIMIIFKQLYLCDMGAAGDYTYRYDTSFTAAF